MFFFNKQINTPSVPKRPFQNHSFVFIITSYNNAKWYVSNLESIRSQTYKNWRIIYVDDCSTDKTYTLVNDYIEKHNMRKKCTLIKNDKNYRQGYSRYIAFKKCHDHEICCLLDGDDWLYSNKVLEKLNVIYNGDISVTYGNYALYSNGTTQILKPPMSQFPPEIIAKNDYQHHNGWITVHLRTGKASLFKSYPYEYLLDFNNELISAATDVNEMYWVLSKSNGKHKNAGFITTVYNKDASLEHENSWFYINSNTRTRLYHTEITYFLKFNQLTRYNHDEVVLIFTNLRKDIPEQQNTLRKLCDLINVKYKLIFKNEYRPGINDVKIKVNHILFYQFENPTENIVKYALSLCSSVFSTKKIHRDIRLFNLGDILIKLKGNVKVHVPKPVEKPVLNVVKHTMASDNVHKIVRNFDELKGLYNYSLVIEHETPSLLNEVVDKIYCINLVKNDSKVNSFIELANTYKISCEILRMTKLKDAAKYMMMFQNVKKRNKNHSSSSALVEPGEFGCLLSHLICLKDAIKHEYNRIIIFEDDVIPIKDLNAKLKEHKHIIENNPLVYLGASQYNWSIIRETKNGYYTPKNTYGTFAMVLDKFFIKKIHDEACKMDAKVDHIPSRLYTNDCVVMYPNLFIADVSESDIRGKRNMVEHCKKVRWDLSKYEYII